MNILERLQDHLIANEHAVNLFISNPNMDYLMPSQKRKVNDLMNNGIGYVWRYGDAEMIHTLTNTNDIFNKTLLIQLGQNVNNQLSLQKVSKYLHEKNYSTEYTANVDLQLEKELKQVKESFFKVKMYNITHAMSGNIDTDDMGSQSGLSGIQSKIADDIKKPVAKKNNLNKMKTALDGALKERLHLDKVLVLQNEFDNTYQVEPSVNLQQVNNYQNPDVYLRDEAIELELERFAKQNFHLKEVTAKTFEISLEGEFPRAIITDLSYQQIHSIVESMEERFGGPSVDEQMHLQDDNEPQNSSLLNDLFNAVKMDGSSNKNKSSGPTMTTRKMPNGQIVQVRNLPKPKPVFNKKKKMKKSAAQVDNSSQYKAAAHARELAKFYAYSQDNHYNYLDVERFELDDMYVNSAYEGGVKNPYTGRLFNIRYVNYNSDLKNDRFKRRMDNDFF